MKMCEKMAVAMARCASPIRVTVLEGQMYFAPFKVALPAGFGYASYQVFYQVRRTRVDEYPMNLSAPAGPVG